MSIKNKYTRKSYLKAKGKIPYGMMNDYIFRIVFQENKYALKGLLCAILGMAEEEILDIRIINEVKPGESISEKEYRMDIVLELNNGYTINLEMQKEDYNNWQYRSLCYLCREFDSLNHGDDYEDVKTAYQISFLNFDLFEDHPEFFARYQMRNVRDGHVYTDRFNLIVISLNQTDIATNDDKAREIDKWARLFKAKTWEELRMVANDNKYMTSAVETVYLSNEDRNMVKIAREREEYLRLEAYRIKKINDLTVENQGLNAANKELEKANAEKDAIIQKYKEKYGDLG